MNVLDVREGYRRWAPSYVGETAISYLEDELVSSMTPTLGGLRLLDAGCGTGRRLYQTGASSVIGVDISPHMIDAGDPSTRHGVTMLVGDIRALPCADASVDVVWCRLVIGHLADSAPAYAEFARVMAPGATVIVSDFHPAAWAAGHRRTFRDADGVHEVEHHVHQVAHHVVAARRAGLRATALHEVSIGPSVRCFYDAAGYHHLYAAHCGLPVVLALSFKRET